MENFKGTPGGWAEAQSGRGFSPHTYLEYETPSHTHILIVGDGKERFRMDPKEAAEELAEAVERCKEYRHKGHGRTHTYTEVDAAYQKGIDQLLTKDFDTEFSRLEWQRAMHKKWGGPMPSGVLMPDAADPREWRIIVPDSTGTPASYKVRNTRLIEEAIEPPDPKFWAPDKQGIGWVRKPQS